MCLAVRTTTGGGVHSSLQAHPPFTSSCTGLPCPLSCPLDAFRINGRSFVVPIYAQPFEFVQRVLLGHEGKNGQVCGWSLILGLCLHSLVRVLCPHRLHWFHLVLLVRAEDLCLC